MTYRTLEQQIAELWKSRGLEVLEERFEAVKGKKGTYRWTITAKEILETK